MTYPVVQRSPSAIAASLPARSALHPARKTFHFLTGFVFALANTNLSPKLWCSTSLLMFLTSFFVEVMRISTPSSSFNTLILKVFRPFARASEAHEFAGIMYYTFGIAITSHVFSRTPATLGILCLATLDPIAALFGTLLQPVVPQARLKNGKSFGGFLFATFAGISVCGVALSQAVETSFSKSDAWATAVLIGVIGACAELLTPTPRIVWGPKEFPIGLDDNAVIPVVCAAVCEVLLMLDYHSVELSPLLFWNPKMGPRLE